MTKNTICLWYNHDAEEAARFYARTFPDSMVGAVYRAPSDFPGGKAGDVLAVNFTVCGVPCMVTPSSSAGAGQTALPAPCGAYRSTSRVLAARRR